jgi:hypothetical protein
MTKQGWRNLSIDEKRTDKLMRLHEISKITNRSFSMWILESAESVMDRTLYLKKTFPQFKVIENHDNMFLFEDTKTNKIIKVTWKDGKAVSNEKNEDYVTYALLHPDFRLR